MTTTETLEEHNRRQRECLKYFEENPPLDPYNTLCDGTFYERQARAQIEMGHREICIVCPGWKVSANVRMFPGTVLVDGHPGADRRQKTFERDV